MVASRASGVETLAIGDRTVREDIDATYASLATRAREEARAHPLSDGDIVVARRARGTATLEEAFGSVGRAPPRLSAIRIETGDATTKDGRRGRGRRARYAFVASEDGDFDADAYGKYATVGEEAPVIRFESRALTRDAQWEVAESRADGYVRLRSCARRDVVLEGTIGGSCTARAAFGAWMAYEEALEREEEYQTTAARECDDVLEKLAEGFKKELRAIEADIIDAGRAQYGKRVVVGDDVESSPRVGNPFSPTANPFERVSPAATSPESHVVELDPLPSLQRRSNAVHPSTPEGAIGSWRGRHVFNEYPSPTDEEIAAVRDESWRFASTTKKSSSTRARNPFDETPPTTTGESTPGMSDYWNFESSGEDDSFFDASTPDTFQGKTRAARRTAATATTTTATTTTTTEMFQGKYSQFTSDDIESAAIRKSGIDPNRVVGTPGTTSAMLKYVGQMYVSEFRSEMNLLNVPYVTLDEVIVDFVELASHKRSQPAFHDPRLNVKEPLSEQYVMSMKTDDFLLSLHDYGDEAGYTEVATLKRALAIAITTKGALSSSDSEY